jgi:hypothetical protein
MLDSFRLGGFPMFPTLLFGALLVAAAARYAMKPEARFVPLQLALGILTLSSGALGFVSGLIKTTTNVGGLEPSRAMHITTVGFGESLCNVGLALGLVTLAALAACIGAARRTWGVTSA